MYIRVFCALILGVLCGGAQHAAEVLQLVDQSAVNMAVGHEDAVYCRMENPNGVTVFEGFGRCVLNIEKVNSLHNGQWRMFIGLPGKVLAELFPLNVRVLQREPKPLVQMSVAMSSDNSSLTVSCSVETASAPKVCKFRDPWGQILIAQQGASEGRYTFQGSGTSTNGAGRHSMDCGLRISPPTTRDLGIWRCGVETEIDTYYGFHLVFSSWLANGTFVQTEPRLQARQSVLGATTGDSAEMICTIPARIRYCYFRSNNGTVITVSPGQSNAVFDYIGSGFDAGECGIRLRHISSSDAGRWTCHVGITDNGISTEEKIHVLVYTQEPVSAILFRSRNGDMGVTAAVNTVGLNIEYCRFVRSDGLGFTNEAVPDGYEFSNSSNLRMCELRILRPTSDDFQSWTVAFGIQGQDYELTANTGALQRNTSSSSTSSFFVLRMTLIFICLGLFFLSLGLLFSSKDKRRWTYARAAAVRDSVRRSLRFRKPPPPVNPPAANANVITSQAA